MGAVGYGKPKVHSTKSKVRRDNMLELVDLVYRLSSTELIIRFVLVYRSSP